MDLYQITTNYACFGVEVNEEGVVVNVAPISKWSIGRSWWRVKEWWLVKRKAKIEKVGY